MPVTPPNKITFFQVLDCLSFHPPTEDHLLLPLFCHRSPLPSQCHMNRMTKMIVHKNSPGFFFFFFLIKTNGQKKFPAPHCNVEHDFRRATIPLVQQQVNILLLYIEEETSVVIVKCRTQVPFSFFSCDGVGTVSVGGDSWGGRGSMWSPEGTCSSCWSHPSFYQISKKG